MKKLFIVTIVLMMFAAGCSSTKKEVSNEEPFIKPITVNPIEVKPIEVEGVVVEEIEIENIQTENIITWDNPDYVTRW